MVFCAAFGCTNTSQHRKDLSWHKLPTDEAKRKIWLIKIGRVGQLPSGKHFVLCSDHFEPSCFERNLKVRTVFLLNTAVQYNYF